MTPANNQDISPFPVVHNVGFVQDLPNQAESDAVNTTPCAAAFACASQRLKDSYEAFVESLSLDNIVELPLDAFDADYPCTPWHQRGVANAKFLAQAWADQRDEPSTTDLQPAPHSVGASEELGAFAEDFICPPVTPQLVPDTSDQTEDESDFNAALATVSDSLRESHENFLRNLSSNPTLEQSANSLDDVDYGEEQNAPPHSLPEAEFAHEEIAPEADSPPQRNPVPPCIKQAVDDLLYNRITYSQLKAICGATPASTVSSMLVRRRKALGLPKIEIAKRWLPQDASILKEALQNIATQESVSEKVLQRHIIESVSERLLQPRSFKSIHAKMYRMMKEQEKESAITKR